MQNTRGLIKRFRRRTERILYWEHWFHEETIRELHRCVCLLKEISGSAYVSWTTNCCVYSSLPYAAAIRNTKSQLFGGRRLGGAVRADSGGRDRAHAHALQGCGAAFVVA